jgi:hypothetical protein
MSYKAESFNRLTSTIDGFRKGANFKSAVSYLSENAKVYVDRQIAQGPKGSEKKLWEQSHNLIVSFIEGASTGDVGIKDIKTLAAELKQVEKAHEERLYSIKEKNKQKAAIPIEANDWGPTGMKYDPGEGAKGVFEKYEHQIHVLNKDTNKAFIATRAPIVVVLSKGFPDILKLRKTGLCEDTLFGYPVLKNQVMIGFHDSYLRDFIANWSKYKKQVKDSVPVNVQLDVDWNAVSDEISQIFKEKSGKSYVKLGKAHRHGKLTWIWMIDSRELARLSQTITPSSFSVHDWALPSEADMNKVHPNRNRP